MDQNQNPPPSTNNQKLIAGLIAGTLIGLLIAFYVLDYFPVLSTVVFNVLLALFFLMIIGALLYFWFKDQILARLFGKDFQVDNTQQEFQKIYDHIAKQYVGKLLADSSKETQEKAKLATPRILKLVVWSFTRSWAFRLIVAVFVAIGGLLGTMLLYNQNQLLIGQNDLLLNQNGKIDTQNIRLNLQNNLMEAERRGSLVILMSDVMNQMNDEIKEDKNNPYHIDSLGYELSDPLIGRIAALSQGFLPYRYLEADTLIQRSISPERGQLLLALVNSKLDSITYYKIYSTTNFSKANLTGASLFGANLDGVYLNEANLSDADLSDADLSGADLSGANLSGANLSGADLNGANLYDAYLNEAELNETNLSRADLTRAALTFAKLYDANLFEANLYEAKLFEADLSSANLIRANLTRTDLYDAYLNDANLSGANLSGLPYLSLNDLVVAKSLYEVQGLRERLIIQLQAEKSCLFAKEGCK